MRVALIGASGYTGLELFRILQRHREIEVSVVTSEQRVGQRVSEAFPSFDGVSELTFESISSLSSFADRADLAFTALPHGTAAPVVESLLNAGLRVIDLSADFRIVDPGIYQQWYGDHGAPEIIGSAVYGLPEVYREIIREADLVAAPGCYPTSVLLPLIPFLKADLIDPVTLHVDSKSGASGAGRKLAEELLFAELDENFYAYNPAGRHRHIPEIEQEATRAAGEPVRIAFVPHLMPIVRGIATTIYARPKRPLSTEQALELLDQAYDSEPFVRVLSEGNVPKLSAVRGANFCDIAAFCDERTGSLVLLSALDNLVKGASGQAIQCLNLMCGFDETSALDGASFDS